MRVAIALEEWQQRQHLNWMNSFSRGMYWSLLCCPKRGVDLALCLLQRECWACLCFRSRFRIRRRAISCMQVPVYHRTSQYSVMESYQWQPGVANSVRCWKVVVLSQHFSTYSPSANSIRVYNKSCTTASTGDTNRSTLSSSTRQRCLFVHEHPSGPLSAPDHQGAGRLRVHYSSTSACAWPRAQLDLVSEQVQDADSPQH